MKARDLIEKGETALVIFTLGKNFTVRDGGFGETGNWRIRKDAAADKVIIYFRNKLKGENEIIVADFVRLHHSREPGFERRFAIEFSNARLAGSTELNWLEFTDSKRGAISPVKYIK
jgi:hypothetical protein